MSELPALAAVGQLADRLGSAVTGTADQRRAQAALADASALVRQVGGTDWIDENGRAAAPGPVVTVVLSAALRVFRNPDGVVSETRGPFTRRRADTEVGVYLTDQETEVVRRHRTRARHSGLWSLATTRGEECLPGHYVMDQYGTEPFPVGDS